MDRFILASLEKASLSPAQPADRRTLIRRATFDLTGLPPTPEETAEFLSDPTPKAFEQVVDRLLASPRYGERWGRHWLDVARYADSKGYVFEDLSVGMEASYQRAVTEADIIGFAEITGDKNPVHLDAAYAAGTMFKERIAHGMLSAGYISAVFGTRLPGPGAIYVSQTLNFRAPVRIGDEVVAKVTLTELIPEKRRAIFACDCSVKGKTVLAGEAVLMVPARPA